MLTLPNDDRSLAPYRLTGVPLTPRAPKVALTRTAFAAAHVVSDPVRERNPWDTRPAVDWEATLGFRVAFHASQTSGLQCRANLSRRLQHFPCA